MVSKTTAEVVRQAMETVRTKDVLGWCRKKLGKTVQAKRREAFAVAKKMEQKSDQVRAVAYDNYPASLVKGLNHDSGKAYLALPKKRPVVNVEKGEACYQKLHIAFT